MGCWRFSAVNIVLLSFCLPILSFTHIKTNLCKWCDYSSPICEDSVCYTNCSLSSFCTLSEEICIAIWRKDNESMSVKTLCHQPQQPLENIMLSNYSSNECVMAPQPSEDGVLFVCGCLGEHECNDKLIFDKGSNDFSKLKSKDVIPVVVISLVPPCLVAIIATMAFYLYRTRQPGKQPKDWAPKRTHYQALDIPEGLSGEAITGGEDCHGKLSAINSDATSDMSPVRAHNFNHSTEQLPIQLEALVGKGRFAEVWRARLHHQAAGPQYETVAVKIFPSVEYVSWSNERAIFSDANLEHENVVQFLTAEERGPSGSPQRQYWLVMAYHGLGNLQDFLAGHVLSWAELCAMAGSVARGLAHLHSDTTPCGIPKVPVAHRDLKSSNIVVKSRRECALCDFGLALRLDLSLTVDDFANSGQVGTARYMAPEVLESRVNLEDLEAFKQMDVYSMALVLWEMVSRCEVIGEVKSYEPPFGSKVCDQPCVDSMRDLVLRDRGRPEIPTSWTTHQGMNLLCATITECWDHDPEARLTAHCVVERFGSLEEEMEQEVLEAVNNSQECPPSDTFPDSTGCDVDPLAPETDTEGTLIPGQISEIL
ncbi:TGF-beta receptor type-2 [Oncorhynchus tshawytscha]|uniref:TGF-beta receptor type-2 n=1 Tax=Oncorhynchus tshawytscha TaxID=74940 RepID=A0A8C8LWP0_ONCTS|nr:TGF-beta receptor type-2 [Oncorhynchus tshawytscha]